MTIPLDDFQVIIRIEFMHMTKLVLMSFLLPKKGETKDPQQIATLQLNKEGRKKVN